MARNGFIKKRAGDSLRDFPSAAVHNAALDAITEMRGRMFGTTRESEPFLRGDVLIRNDSGFDRDRFEILGIQEPTVTPVGNLLEFQNNLVLSGVMPTKPGYPDDVPQVITHARRFAVLAEALPRGQIGLAFTHSVCVVRVVMTSFGDEWADIDPTQDVGESAWLRSGPSGGAQILYHEGMDDPDNFSETSVYWAVVRLGAGEDAAFYARITDGPADFDCTESGSGGSGSGSFSCTNAYAWKEVRPIRCGYFEDLEGGRSGDLTVNPAFETSQATDVPVGSIVRMHRGFYDKECDVQECLFSFGPGGSGGAAIILVLGMVVTPSMLTNCTTGSGSGNEIACRTKLHFGMLQTYDEDCDAWTSHYCVLIADINANTLQPTRRYRAWPSKQPVLLQGIPIPVDSPCQNDPTVYPVYFADEGDPTRTLLIIRAIGSLCPSEESGSGATGSGSSSTASEPVCADTPLKVYEAQPLRFDIDLCAWTTADESVYVTEKCGHKLPTGLKLIGEYHTMAPVLLIEGEGTGDGPGGGGNGNDGPAFPGQCKPLYMVECPGITMKTTAVEKIECQGNLDVSCTEGMGDVVITFRIEQWVCGHLVKRTKKVVRSLCCCTIGCFPGAGVPLKCPPCDALDPADVATAIVGTIAVTGDCQCVAGSYVMTSDGYTGCYSVQFTACTDKFGNPLEWYFALCCTTNGWVAVLTCGPCDADTSDLDNPPAGSDCAIIATNGTVTNCQDKLFSGGGFSGCGSCPQSIDCGDYCAEFTFTG